MAPFYGWGSTVSRLHSHNKETVYFSPLSPQSDQHQKDEKLSEP